MLGQYNEYINNPIEFLDNLSEKGSIHKIQIYSELSGWLVTGYDAAKEILRNPCFGRDNKRLQGILATHGCAFWDLTSVTNNMLNSDLLDHTRLRKIAIKPFTSAYLQNQEHWIRQRVKELIAEIPLGEEFDFISLVAKPLPMDIIYGLLGIPEGIERDDFNTWIEIMFTNQNRELIVPILINIYNHINSIIKTRQSYFIEEDSVNLIDQLIIANSDGDRLNEEELYATISLLLIAGSETTQNLIANLISALGSDQELQTQIRKNLELIPDFIEEVLRHNGPFHTSMIRFVYDDTIIADTLFRHNEIVLVSNLAANRDRRIYSNPKEFELNRKAPPHIAFGFGPHVCIGANLAKLEATIVLEELLQCSKNITLTKNIADLPWRVTSMIRGRTEIPVILN